MENTVSSTSSTNEDSPKEDTKQGIAYILHFRSALICVFLVAESKDNDKNEARSNDKNVDFKMCSPKNRRPATVSSSNPFATPPPKSSSGILKPPQLNVNNTNSAAKPSFVLTPSRLNPFAGRSNANDNLVKPSQTNGETPKFVPLIQSETKTNSTVVASSSTAGAASFVFGQNLQERVIASESKSEEPKASTSLNSNGTTEMLFSSAIKNEIKTDKDSHSSNKEVKSLSESAREYEESRAVKRKYEEVEIVTGEEDEINILNITCKLFAFDKGTGTWQERGRGVLRLNDFERENQEHSRLLFRTMGSFRLVLNTPVSLN